MKHLFLIIVWWGKLFSRWLYNRHSRNPSPLNRAKSNRSKQNRTKRATGLNSHSPEKNLTRPTSRQKTSSSSVFRGVPLPKSSQSDRKSVPIPPREIAQNRSSVEVRPSLSTPSGRFVEQAKKFVNTTERQADPAPFKQYWPTYESMNSAQRKWYFYWRSQVRHSSYLPTDLSYIFLHVYEVIHLIGFDSAEDAFEHLANIWRRYRVKHPELDSYLIDWLADFIVVYRLPQTPMNWYSYAIKRGGHLTDRNLLIEALLSDGSANLMHLSSDMLELISGHKYTNSKFYQQHNNNGVIDRELRRGLDIIDKYLRQKHGKTLFNYYRPVDVHQIKRYPFTGAIYEGKHGMITVANVPAWLNASDLRNAMASTLKYIENRLRRQQNYRGTLKGIELPSEWIAILDSAFPVQDQKIRKQSDASIEDRITITTDKPLVIDYAKVELLTLESDTVRNRLQVNEESEITANKALVTENGLEKADERLPVVLDTERSPDTPVHLPTEFEGVAKVIRGSKVAINLLRNLRTNNWKMRSDLAQNILNGEFLNVVLDRINERAIELLGDQLIFIEDDELIVTEEYRGEIEHLLN